MTLVNEVKISHDLEAGIHSVGEPRQQHSRLFWMLSTVPSLPRRTDSLSTSVVKPKSSSVLVQCREDAALARNLLGTLATNEDRHNVEANVDDESRRDDRDGQLTQMLGRMTDWVEELVSGSPLIIQQQA